MRFNDFYHLLKEYGNIPKCLNCQGYQGAMVRLSKDGPQVDSAFPSRDIYGFLNCKICPPLDILEEYLKTEGKKKFLKPRKKKFSLDEFSVKLFLRKISGEF